MRIGQAAAGRKVAVKWRPFLLGPIFRAQGWNTSPFAIYPAKGRYMWRDIERRAARFGLPFKRPDADDPRSFPQNSLLAARMALVALEEPWGEGFCRDVFFAEWVDGRDISEAAVLEELASRYTAPAELVEQALSPGNKERLKKSVEEAAQRGLFGAPSFTIGNELFWGDDRLEDALEWADAIR